MLSYIMDINKVFQSAFEYYQAGKLQQAKDLFKNILRKQPENLVVLNFLGVIYYQLGHYDSAIGHIKKALNINPLDYDAWYNMGNALHKKGDLDEAVICFKKTIELKPNFAGAYNNLGNVVKNKGQINEAIFFYQKAIELTPDVAVPYSNLGNILQEKGQLDEAITYYQRAIQLNPVYAQAYYNLGNALQQKGQVDEVITYYQKAIQLSPVYAQAYYGLGTIFQEKGRLDDAIMYYQKAIQLDPQLVEAYHNLGLVLAEQDKKDEAIVAYDSAIGLNPNLFKARLAKCMAHLSIIYPDQSSIEISRNRYHEELLKLRDEVRLKTPQDVDVAAEAVGYYAPFFLAYQGYNDRELQRLYGGLVCRIMASRYPQWAIPPDMPASYSREPLRIGIVSRFFYLHSVWKIPTKGWIENLDQRRFILYGYSAGKEKDKTTEHARKYFTKFVEDIFSFEELCRIIREDNLHILLYPEIGMDPMTIRLASLRLAPVQCTSWGHPVTSGLPTIDYFLSSDLMETPDAADHYTEKLIRLPNLSIHYSPLDVPYADVNCGAFGLRQKSILYHCCQMLYKYLPQYDEIFPRIAHQVGNCQFLFSSSPKSRWVTEKFQLRIKQAFARFGLNADDYVIFLPFLEVSQYNALYKLADIFLDPIGWSGCNSVLEAIAHNLPVITFPGMLMRGREGSAILSMMGLTDTIAESLDDYISIAVRLGQDSEWCREISEKFATNKHLVYRDQTCITALEDFFERVVKERRPFC